jgi:hypothetical protein
MSVYVDDMRAPFRGMIMCHMIADTTEELLAMADRIGVARRWIQPGRVGCPHHFDICLSKRKQAVAAGAIAVGQHDFVMKLREIKAKVAPS